MSQVFPPKLTMASIRSASPTPSRLAPVSACTLKLPKSKRSKVTVCIWYLMSRLILKVKSARQWLLHSYHGSTPKNQEHFKSLWTPDFWWPQVLFIWPAAFVMQITNLVHEVFHCKDK